MQNYERARLYLKNLPLFQDKKIKEELNLIESVSVKAGVITGLVLATLYMLHRLTQYFDQFNKFRKTGKEEKKLAKELAAIMDSNKRWTIISVMDKDPNAMTLGRNFIIITRGLYKLLNDDEVMAVILHEAGHNAGKHVGKSLAAYGTFAVIAGQASGLFMATTVGLIPVAAAIIAGPTIIFFGLLIFFIFLGKPIELYKVTTGRKHEYFSDSYAVKYGYKDHLLSALKKTDKWANSEMKKRPCGRECKLQIEMSEKMDEHPSIKDRVENIMNTKSQVLMKIMKSPSALKTFFYKELGIKT